MLLVRAIAYPMPSAAAPIDVYAARLAILNERNIQCPAHSNAPSRRIRLAKMRVASSGEMKRFGIKAETCRAVTRP